MWKKKDEEQVSDPIGYVEDLFASDSSSQPDKTSEAKGLAEYSLIAVIMGLVLALLVTPIMIPSIAAAQASNHYWESLDVVSSQKPLSPSVLHFIPQMGKS